MKSKQYIKSYFVNRKELVERSGVPDKELDSLIQAKCFPAASYTVETKAKISSFFGEFEEHETEEYFPEAAVGLLQQLAARDTAIEDLSERVKTEFIREYCEVLLRLKANKFGLIDLWNKSTGAPCAEHPFFEQEWQHYLDGTYGVCTKTASASDIATKEAMIAKIKYLHEQSTLDPQEDSQGRILEAADILDAVSAPFAPHELERSSRHKYINKMRTRYGVDIEN